jgi:hypothetical protein
VDTVSSKSNQQLMADLFMGALRANDEQLNALAAELVVRSGHGAMPRLIQGACDHSNRPAHRLRLLEVINRLGPPFGEAFFDLNLLLRDSNSKIRQAAAELVGVGVDRRV